jgi:hypothetical protein
MPSGRLTKRTPSPISTTNAASCNPVTALAPPVWTITE